MPSSSHHIGTCTLLGPCIPVGSASNPTMVYPVFLAAVKRRAVMLPAASSSRSRALFSTQPVQEIETFLSGTSSLYAEQMYEQYLEDPNSLHPSWKQYFDNLEQGIAFSSDDYSRPSTIPGKRSVAVAGVSWFQTLFAKNITPGF